MCAHEVSFSNHFFVQQLKGGQTEQDTDHPVTNQDIAKIFAILNFHIPSESVVLHFHNEFVCLHARARPRVCVYFEVVELFHERVHLPVMYHCVLPLRPHFCPLRAHLTACVHSRQGVEWSGELWFFRQVYLSKILDFLSGATCRYSRFQLFTVLHSPFVQEALERKTKNFFISGADIQSKASDYACSHFRSMFLAQSGGYPFIKCRYVERIEFCMMGHSRGKFIHITECMSFNGNASLIFLHIFIDFLQLT